MRPHPLAVGVSSPRPNFSGNQAATRPEASIGATGPAVKDDRRDSRVGMQLLQGLSRRPSASSPSFSSIHLSDSTAGTCEHQSK